MKAVNVIEGDSTDVIVVKHRINGKDVTDYTNYTMTIKVLNAGTKEKMLEKNIEHSNDVNGYKIVLYPDETEKLGKGGFLIVGNLSKVEDGVKTFNRQLVWGLNIEERIKE